MVQHITVPGQLVFDPSTAITQDGLYNTLRLIKPEDPNLQVVSIAIPFVHINCKETGVIDLVTELKNAAERLYDYFIKYYIQPAWNALYSLYEALKNLGLGVLDLTIPFFDLHISDLFDPNLFTTIKEKVLNLYYNAKQTLIDILKALGIRFPFTFGTFSPELEIEEIVKAICNSLWGFLLKAFKKLIQLCKLGTELWEAINTNGIPTWSSIIERIEAAVMGAILDFLTNVPSINDIYNSLVNFAKSVYNKAAVTAQEIIAVIKDFTFGIFGKLFNFSFPTWNPNVSNPELDLMRMLNQMLLYLKNFLLSTITNFVKGIVNVLKQFGVALAELLTFTIPITLCAIVSDEPGTATTPKVAIP